MNETTSFQKEQLREESESLERGSGDRYQEGGPERSVKLPASSPAVSVILPEKNLSTIAGDIRSGLGLFGCRSYGVVGWDVRAQTRISAWLMLWAFLFTFNYQVFNPGWFGPQTGPLRNFLKAQNWKPTLLVLDIFFSSMSPD